jgi:hypothetical protein
MDTIRAHDEMVGALAHVAPQFNMPGELRRVRPCKYHFRKQDNVCQRTESIFGSA